MKQVDLRDEEEARPIISFAGRFLYQSSEAENSRFLHAPFIKIRSSPVSLLMFAKFIYIGAITNYLTFYLIAQFGLTARSSQVYLFCFLAAVAVGVFIGGPLSDRIGQKNMIWFSFLGVAPLTLLMPHVGLTWTAVLVSVVGLVLSTSLSALVVYAQEIVPGRVGMVSGIMYGLMFGFSGIAAAGLGYLADIHGIVWVYQLIAYLPLLGFATALLPKLDHG